MIQNTAPLAYAANGQVISLTKSGSGILTLSGANTFSGTTTISGGTLQVGAGGGSGALGGSGPVTIGSGATLLFNRNDSSQFTIANSISGSGALAFTSPGGTLVGQYGLSGNNSGLSGPITIANSRVNVTNQLGTARHHRQSGRTTLA